jgi:Zn-dependent peptidase ImmA (M78 family)/transcriptional regulator with XRE-family HTH domain
MSVGQKEIAERIKIARESCGMTQEDVSLHLGVSRPSIVQIEQGNRAVSSLELQKMAGLFGRDLRDFFKEDFKAEDAIVALFRAEADSADREPVLEELRKCIVLGRELTNLEQLLGIARDLRAVAQYPLATPQKRWDAITQGDRIAEEERRRLGLGQTPAPDLIELLEAQGVRTAVVPLPSDVSGLTISDGRVGLFIVTNGDHGWQRRRFSFAHEYGHVLMDRERSGLISRASRKDDLPEIRANAFAASFLMPREGLRQFVSGLGKGRPSRMRADLFDEAESVSVEGRSEPHSQDIQLYDLVQVAHHFGVSRSAALYRLANLKLANDEEFQRLKAAEDAGQGRRMAKLLGLPDLDHAAAQNEFRHRFVGLALESYRRELVTKGKLRELATMVGLGADAVRNLIESAGIDGNEGGAAPLLPG